MRDVDRLEGVLAEFLRLAIEAHFHSATICGAMVRTASRIARENGATREQFLFAAAVAWDATAKLGGVN